MCATTPAAETAATTRPAPSFHRLNERQKRISHPRTDKRPYRVVVHGLAYFCQKLPAFLKSERWEVLDRSGHGATELFRIVQDLSRCDLAYTWGGRISMGKFLWAARLLRKKRLVMLW